MSSRIAAKRHNSCNNKRFYTNISSTQPQIVLYQEIVDQTQSESSSGSELSGFSSSQKSSLSLTADEPAERSKSSTNSNVQLEKRQAMSKNNQQSSIHIHLKAKPRKNDNSVKKGKTSKHNISQMSIKSNPSPVKYNNNSLKSSQMSQKMEYSHLLAHKSPFQITIKGSKDGSQTLESQISQTKPKNQFSDTAFCDEIAYTNLKLKQPKEIQGGIADHISTTAKQGTEYGKKPKKNANSGVDTTNNVFSTSNTFQNQDNLLTNAKLINNTTNPLIYNANPKYLTRSESESYGQYYQKKGGKSSNLSITIGKKNGNSKVTENDETKRNLKKKKNMFLVDDDIEKSREEREDENDEDVEDQKKEEAYSAQTSVTQMKRTEDSLVQDWKESKFSKEEALFEQSVPKDILNKPFFLFDDNNSNKNLSKAIDDTEFNNWLIKGQGQKPNGVDNIWNVWKNKREKDENQNNKRLKKTIDQSTVNYEKMRYTTQGKDKMKFYEFNCFRDRDLGVPEQYMNKLQEITIDDDVMTDDDTKDKYIEVCFADLLEGIEMDQNHEDGVDHLWDYFYPPSLSQSQ